MDYKYRTEGFMMKKQWLVLLVLIGVVVLFLFSSRLLLYKDYQNAWARTEMIRALAINQEIIHYDQPLSDHTHSYDGHLFLSLDENYSIVYEGEDGVEYGLGPNYQIRPDAKAIGIFKMGEPLYPQFANQLAQNTSLSAETISSIIQSYSFQRDIDAFLYVIDQPAHQKLSLFSSKDTLQREIIPNGAAEQFTQSFFGVDDEAPMLTRLTGNINGIELID